MAREKQPLRASSHTMSRPTTIAGHAAASHAHAKLAARHAAKAEQMAHDRMRETPKSRRRPGL